MCALANNTEPNIQRDLPLNRIMQNHETFRTWARNVIIKVPIVTDKNEKAVARLLFSDRSHPRKA